MIRRIIQIDEEKCNGCGICADACHEGAIGIIEGKAKLLRDDYCDGLGDCLPACPTGAISFIEREAAEYDEEAVLKSKKEKMQTHGKAIHEGCPGSRQRQLIREQVVEERQEREMSSQLSTWPVQIKLVPEHAAYFDNANLLIAADCTAYAYANFHNEFIHGKVTLIGCPKLDDVYYADKLTNIIKNNNIKSVTIVRMEVPCCGGLESAAVTALKLSGKFIPWQVVTISIDGKILE